MVHRTRRANGPPACLHLRCVAVPGVAGGFFPQPLLPLPACQVNPKDEQAAQAACDACKAAVTVTVRAGRPAHGSSPASSARATPDGTRRS